MIMKKKILFAIAATAIIAACTHNDGNIGDWFGAWKLREITINGTPDAAYGGNMFWKFQSATIEICVLDEYHGRTDSWGSWEEVTSSSGKVLRLNFTHSDNDHPVGSSKYSPPKVTHLPAATISDLDVLQLNSKNLHLRYVAPDATVYEYTFTKQ